MGFIEDAQALLRGEAAPEGEAIPGWVDLEQCRRVMWESLDTLSGEWLRMAHGDWTTTGTFERRVGLMARALDIGIGAVSPGRRARLLANAVRMAVGGATDLDGLSTLESLEVTRSAQAGGSAFRDEGWPTTDEWVRGMGFLAPNGTVAALGRAFLDLRGRTALQFVLEVGTRSSVGWSDELRIAKPVLAQLRTGWSGDLCDAPGILHTAQKLGLTEYTENGAEFLHITVTQGLEDLIDTVLSDEPNPIRALAEALLASEVGALEAQVTGRAPPSIETGYSRLVIHELNNALLPLGSALNKLWATLGTPGPHDPNQLSALRSRIDRQVDRLQQFAAESGRLLEATAPEQIPLRTLVEEAERETEGDRNGRIGVNIEGLTNIAIEGSRGRWLLCFVNLFRNSAQARAGRGVVRVSAEWDATGQLHIYVDDDGPGVPEELRARIFEQGVSQRGGMGLGLFDARATVRLSGGSMTCEESPLGGARFHMHLPARRTS